MMFTTTRYMSQDGDDELTKNRIVLSAERKLKTLYLLQYQRIIGIWLTFQLKAEAADNRTKTVITKFNMEPPFYVLKHEHTPRYTN